MKTEGDNQMDSYGYIETMGLLTAIEAADAALKAANVVFTNCYIVKGGIVTVELAGDVAAVTAAVEAGSESARKLGNFISKNVIARVDDETKKILKGDTFISDNNKNGKTEKEISEEELLQNEMEKEVEQMNINISHDLIVAVINQGDSEKLMTAARTAGARGGTMFHALKMGVGEAEKFFGISVQQKKDIVAIITKRENKESIMKAINQFCDGENKAVVFSLPVDNVFGIA